MQHTYHKKPGYGAVYGVVMMLALCLVFGTCKNAVGPDDDQDDGGGTVPVVTEDKGTLEFVVRGLGGRAVLGADLSSGLANTWEVLLVNSTGVLTTLKLVPGEAAAVTLVPDTYTVLALAGYRRSTTSLTTQLLGSACADEPVEVVVGQNQAVELVLRALDFTFDVPASLDAGSLQTLSVFGQSRNPHVGMLLDGSASNRPRLRSTVLWNGYRDFDTFTGSATDWQARVSITMPTLLGACDVGFCGAPVTLTGCGTADGVLTDRTAYSWKWPNTYDLQDTDALKLLVSKTTEIVAPQTGVSLTLGWE